MSSEIDLGVEMPFVQLARMEGKLDQVITDHERRLSENSQTLSTLASRVDAQGLLIATNGANIATHSREISELEARSTGALGKAMTVVSPIIAAGSLVTAVVLGTR